MSENKTQDESMAFGIFSGARITPPGTKEFFGYLYGAAPTEKCDMYLHPDPRIAEYRELLRQAAIACECVPKGVRNGDHISLPGRIRVALEKP